MEDCYYVLLETSSDSEHGIYLCYGSIESISTQIVDILEDTIFCDQELEDSEEVYFDDYETLRDGAATEVTIQVFSVLYNGMEAEVILMCNSFEEFRDEFNENDYGDGMYIRQDVDEDDAEQMELLGEEILSLASWGYRKDLEEYNCLAECIEPCEMCGSYIEVEEVDLGEMTHICSECLEANYQQCDRCGEWNDPQYMDFHTLTDGDVVCDDCFDPEDDEEEMDADCIDKKSELEDLKIEKFYNKCLSKYHDVLIDITGSDKIITIDDLKEVGDEAVEAWVDDVQLDAKYIFNQFQYRFVMIAMCISTGIIHASWYMKDKDKCIDNIRSLLTHDNVSDISQVIFATEMNVDMGTINQTMSWVFDEWQHLMKRDWSLDNARGYIVASYRACYQFGISWYMQTLEDNK